MSKHTCPTCQAEIERDKFICLGCWRLVPAALRADVNRTYRAVVGIRASDIRGPRHAREVLDAIARFRKAQQFAIAAVTERQIRREMAE